MKPPAPVVAELGPTNTGKTHRAIERMLEHESGMIGLPLRLLAREVYDRVTARVGEARVALVTGEEKRVPHKPDYWVCTVEAMPVGERVEFLAVDEIQLCAHRERGHVFTDRLLHARGRNETWFLGADTMRPIMRELLPAAVFRRSERMSRLKSFGARSLKSLPARSAVVAFSTERVYELAEALRGLRGGVAVVLGGLSPRTRNAQVALYQAGEVQYLVATDAIGMGLNLDLERVAFAATSKFDGFEQRELTVDELAQIAGRAGRHVKDGEFGTLTTGPELPPGVIKAIEAHRFPAVKQLVWRNVELDFTGIRALLDTLSAAPKSDVSPGRQRVPGLTPAVTLSRHRSPPAGLFSRVERADDFDALKALSTDDDVVRLAARKGGVELLWEVCRIPDFRKGLIGEHVRIVKEVFTQLSDGRLEEDWLKKHVAPLDDLTGDIHTLTSRLEAIRTWTYISHRASWLTDAAHWQQKTRAIEDALGDALHQRLVERFVLRAAMKRSRRFRTGDVPKVEGPFAKLGAMVDSGPTADDFVQSVVSARGDALELDATGRIVFEGELLGRLVRGPDRRSPQVQLTDDVWNGGQRALLERRLTAFARDVVAQAMGGFPAEALSAQGRAPAVRAVAFRFAEGLGIARRDESLLEQVALLDEASHRRLDQLGVRAGSRFLIVAPAVMPAALERRCVLTSLFEEQPRPAGAPFDPVVSREAMSGRDAEAYGYAWLGPIAVRIDVLETLAAAVAAQQALGPIFEALGVGAAERAVV
ncbi:MAG: helicase, partial [Myxococcaceae bacterium]|nr:helicase [Myxococcaceae bacterium]